MLIEGVKMLIGEHLEKLFADKDLRLKTGQDAHGVRDEHLDPLLRIEKYATQTNKGHSVQSRSIATALLRFLLVMLAPEPALVILLKPARGPSSQN
jgi:hypothetical protein